MKYDNPNSPLHYAYQSMANRVLFLQLAILCFVFSVSQVGWLPTLVVTFVIIPSVAILTMFCLFVLSELKDDFLYWLKGF